MSYERISSFYGRSIFILSFVLLSFCLFFPRLISAVAEWMSAILAHAFKMQVWNTLYYRT